MKKSTFVANMIVWGVLLAVSAVLIAVSADDAAVEENIVLLAASIFARPVAGFSLGALLAVLVAKASNLHLSHTARIVWRVLGIVPTALLCLSPFLIPVLPDEAATVFAVVLLLAVSVPIAFALFGAFLGLSFAGEKPAEEDEEE